jgi:hypothetical protein
LLRRINLPAVKGELEDQLQAAASTAAWRFPAFGWSGAIFTTTVAAISGLAVWTGLGPIKLFGHDTFFLLDNAYRVLQGQVPHRDFSSAWGPLTYWIEAAGLLISRLQPAGIGYANALFGALIAVWAYRIGRARLFPANACVLGIYTALLITGPFSLGWGTANFTHAMTYNRYGYALLGIILIECGPHILSVKLDRRVALTGALSTGAALAALAFLKVSYAILAIPFIGIALTCGHQRRRRCLTVCAAFGLVAFLALCYLRFDLPDMVRDLVIAASSRNKSWHPGDILRLAFGQATECLPLLLLSVITWRKRPGPLSDPAVPLRAGLIVLLTLLTGGIAISTNHQASTLPLNGFAAILLADVALVRFRFGSRPAGAPPEPAGLVAVFLMTVCIVPLSVANLLSLIVAGMEEHRPAAAAPVRLASDRGASINFAPVPVKMTTETGGPEYVIALNDGLALLRRHTGSRDGVLTLDMMNPFNYLLDRPSPRGGMAAAAYNYIFSDAAHPSPDRFFGDTRYVLVRKYSRSAADSWIESPHIAGLKRIYGPLLCQRFRVIEETTHWLLYGPK